MNDKSDHKMKTDDILNSLDGVQRATPRPYLHTRIMARLNRNNTGWERMATLISKPVVAFATIALFLLVNVAVLYHLSATATTTTVSQDSTTPLVSDNEYNLSVSSLYDINPSQNDVAQK